MRDRIGLLGAFSGIAIGLMCMSVVFGQGQKGSRSECIVNKFLADKKTKISMSAENRFTNSEGVIEAEVNDKGMATIKASFKNLRSPLDIGDTGGQFATYVVWLVHSNGKIDRLERLQTKGNDKATNVSVEKKEAVQEFGILLTLEPHRHVELPGLLVLSSGQSSGSNAQTSGMRTVPCIFSDRDYLRPKIVFSNSKQGRKERNEYFKKPLEIYEAEYALYWARDAGADTDATDKFNEADTKFKKVLELYSEKRFKEADRDIEPVIGLAAEAEQDALRIQQTRQNSLEKERFNEKLNDERNDRIKAGEELERVQGELQDLRDEHKMQLVEFGKAAGEIAGLKKLNDENTREITRLKNENADLVAKAQRDRDKLLQLRNALEWGRDLSSMVTQFAVFGKVERLVNDGMLITFPETIWEIPGEGKVKDDWLARIDPLITKLAGAKFLEIQITSFYSSDDYAAAEKRAKGLAQHLIDRNAGERLKIDSRIEEAATTKKLDRKTQNRIQMIVRLADAF